MLATRKPHTNSAYLGFPTLDRVFTDFSDLFPDIGACTDMRVDFSDQGDNYILRSDVPGVAKDDINVTIKEDTLHLTCQRKSESDEKERRFLRERKFGKITRSFTLPQDVDSNAVSAVLENGVLILTIGKLEKAKPRQIEVRVT